jgi:hypothetical protein
MMFKKENFLLLLILIFAVAVRIAGVGYGLPLWLIDDEPAFALAALKMIQLKTVFPAAHFEEFKSVLYYPPYLSYFYLPFFAVLLGIKYLFYAGTQFADYLGADLSGFFIIVRVLHVILASVSIWLVYRTGKTIFKDAMAGLGAAFLLATSLLHIALSPNGRHWLPVSFIMALGLFILTRENWSYRRRYFLTVFVAGLGMGVSVMSGFLGLLMVLHYLFIERRGIAALFKDWFSYAILLLFGFLAWLPKWLYPGSYGFGVDVTAGEAKALLGAILAPFLFLKPILISEPALMILALFGLLAAFRYARSWFWVSILFAGFYSLAFYQFFRFEHRFVLGLFPLLAILAGGGFAAIFKYLNIEKFEYTRYLLLVIVIVFQVLVSARLGYLMYRGDSRELAREWAEANIPAGEKIIVNARLTRVAALPAATEEQKNIQENSLRRADVSEAALGGSPFYKSFHALNLFTVTDGDFYEDFEDYIKGNKYQYLILSLEDFQKNEARQARWRKLADNGQELAVFGASDKVYSLTGGYFGGVPGLFRISQFGPPVGIYKLNYIQ